MTTTQSCYHAVPWGARLPACLVGAASIGVFLIAVVAPIAVRADSPVTVEIDLDGVIRDDFLGVGVQWSSYPWWDVSDADWEKVFRRVEFMRVPFARVMLDGFWYCQGFDEAGDPIYTWDTSYMQKLYKLLDWCEANNVRVMIGEWGRPCGSDLHLTSVDPRWARIVGEFIEHMTREKGYTCLTYYNLINEPHGYWSGITWREWKTAIGNLHAELRRRGLLDQVPLALPDADRAFTARMLQDADLAKMAGVYDEHWYVHNQEILDGRLERYTIEQLQLMCDRDPGKHYFLGEIGILDGKANGDQQKNVFNFWYGVSMADAAIQMMRGGMSGFCAWDLDDAMHFLDDGPESMNALSDVLPEDAYQRRKIWGFWDIMGAEHGNPEAEQMRPWYFTWSILSRSFPPGCELVRCGDSGVARLRVAAARIPGDQRDDLSVAVVNNEDRSIEVRLVLSGVDGPVTLAQYDYFDQDGDNRVDAWPETVGADGEDVFPSATHVFTSVDLTEGIVVQLPSRGVVILSTVDVGEPVPMGRKKPEG